MLQFYDNKKRENENKLMKEEIFIEPVDSKLCHFCIAGVETKNVYLFRFSLSRILNPDLSNRKRDKRFSSPPPHKHTYR